MERVLPLLASQDMDALHKGGMFMTEQGAGSGIAATAEPANDATHLQASDLLRGDKWFCSNPDAELALAGAASNPLYHLTSAAALARGAARTGAGNRAALARLVLTHRVLPRDRRVL